MVIEAVIDMEREERTGPDYQPLDVSSRIVLDWTRSLCLFIAPVHLVLTV